MAQMFQFSALVLVQNICSFGMWNVFSWIDIVLQICMMKTTWVYVSIVDIIRPVPPLPVLPPYDDNIVTDSKALLRNSIFRSEPSTTTLQEVDSNESIPDERYALCHIQS